MSAAQRLKPYESRADLRGVSPLQARILLAMLGGTRLAREAAHWRAASGERFPDRSVQAMRRAGLLLTVEPRKRHAYARLSLTGDWYARTLVTAAEAASTRVAAP